MLLPCAGCETIPAQQPAGISQSSCPSVADTKGTLGALSLAGSRAAPGSQLCTGGDRIWAVLGSYPLVALFDPWEGRGRYTNGLFVTCVLIVCFTQGSDNESDEEGLGRKALTAQVNRDTILSLVSQPFVWGCLAEVLCLPHGSWERWHRGCSTRGSLCDTQC